MAKTVKTERELLEDEKIRIDRTLALDRRKFNKLKANIDALTDERLRVEARLAAIRSSNKTG
jgi:hypothetical protein